MTGIELNAVAESFPIAGAFTISRGTRTQATVVTVKLCDGDVTGRGECTPYPRYGETIESVMELIHSLAADFRHGLDRAALQKRLPAGAARNALDCALWDLEAKKAGKSVWQLAGLAAPRPLSTAYTLSLGSPDDMRAVATRNASRPLLKVKLGGEGDLERIEAVRAGAPDADIIVDANEGWTVKQYTALAPDLVRLGVMLVEQPLPAGQDGALADVERLLPVCADESCHDRASLSSLADRYDAINIKLDKTGGLTEALALREEALGRFGIMVGCMLGTSLAMAPAFLVAQGASYVDLDAPLLLAADRDTPIRYDGSIMQPTPPALWG